MKRLLLLSFIALSLLLLFSTAIYAQKATGEKPAEAIPEGKITGIDKTQVDAYRISLKGSDGIRFGDIFQIVRGDRVIAEAYLVSTDPDRCVISLKGAASSPVETGDVVRFLRHKKDPPRTVVSNALYLGMFRDCEGRADLVECTRCALKMDKSFILKFNDRDHYVVCRGKSHEFFARAASQPRSGGSGAEMREGMQNINTSRDAQELFKAPDDWTEKVSTVKHEDWGKQIYNHTLPSVNNIPCVSGYGKTDDGKEIKMQVIQGNGCIRVVSP